MVGYDHLTELRLEADDDCRQGMDDEGAAE